MELKDRLKHARNIARMTQVQVCNSVGMTQASYSELERGLVKSSGKIVEIAKCLGVQADWLATGKGEMKAMQSNIRPDFYAASDWDDNTPIESDEYSVPFYRDFAFACGHGSALFADESETRRLRISRATIARIGSTPSQIFATVADGDSMSPTISDGNTIWVDTSKQNIKDGRIFAFEYGGLFMCKRLYRLPNDGLRVVSDNAVEYEEFIIDGDARIANEFKLIGWVWHWSVMESW